MKKSVIILTLFIALSAIGNAATARGQAVIPMFYNSHEHVPYFVFSNITDSQITVKVTFYKENGTILSDSGQSDPTNNGIIKGINVNSFDDSSSEYSVSFTINAHCSGIIYLHTPSGMIYGHGRVEWLQDNSKAIKGLVAGVFAHLRNDYTEKRGDAMYSIQINNGQPF